jgi:hypothetical protein
MAKVFKMRTVKGLAQSTLDNLRDRRKEMKLKLSKTSISLLNTFLRQPYLINVAMQQSGLVTQQGAPKHYQAPSTDVALKVLSIKKNWLEKKVMVSKSETEFAWSEETKEYPLAKAYVKILQEVVAYYAPIGMLVDWTEHYMGLKLALDGKDMADELEDTGDLLGADGSPEEPSAPATAKPDEAAAAN